MAQPDRFAATVESWHDFYMLAGSAAATLLGLLFVAVSLNLRIFTDPKRPELRARAINSFESFVYLVLFALMFLIPDQSPAGLAWPLLIFSVVRLVSVQRVVGRVRRATRPGVRGYLLALAPTISYAVVAVMTAGTLLGHEGLLSFEWLIAVVSVLLGSATGNAWDLLIHAFEDEEPPPAGRDWAAEPVRVDDVTGE